LGSDCVLTAFFAAFTGSSSAANFNVGVNVARAVLPASRTRICISISARGPGAFLTMFLHLLKYAPKRVVTLAVGLPGTVVFELVADGFTVTCR
jgi:hypothetical protein